LNGFIEIAMMDWNSGNENRKYIYMKSFQYIPLSYTAGSTIQDVIG
ncbi:22118_t:CDS:1, partial [Racocetra persica]